MASITGSGVVFGIETTGGTFTGFTGTLLWQDENFENASDLYEVRHGNGDVVGACFYNQTENFTFTVLPSGATMTAARSANVLPSPGMKMSIIASPSTAVDLDIDAATPGKDYCVISAAKTRAFGTACAWQVVTKRWGAIINYTPLAS
jgi:hypothetical protein